MTPSQESKFDEMYRTVLEIQGDMKVFNEQRGNIRDAVIENAKEITLLKVDMNEYKADRNKVVGVAWLGGGLGAIGAFVYEIFFKHS